MKHDSVDDYEYLPVEQNLNYILKLKEDNIQTGVFRKYQNTQRRLIYQAIFCGMTVISKWSSNE